MTVLKLDDHFLINDRFAIYFDGVIYDTLKAKDIPQFIFKLRDQLLNNKEG